VGAVNPIYDHWIFDKGVISDDMNIFGELTSFKRFESHPYELERRGGIFTA
jgi:hypothetical protein